MGVRPLIAAALLACGAASADAAERFAARWSQDGKHFDARDEPTFHVGDDGTVDWFTYAGHAHYDRQCRACHGDPAAGSELARPLIAAVLRDGHFDFTDWVTNGGFTTVDGVQRVMPAFGTNPGVMCHLDDIFIYLRAVAAGVISGPPVRHAPKPASYGPSREACLGD